MPEKKMAELLSIERKSNQEISMNIFKSAALALVLGIALHANATTPPQPVPFVVQTLDGQKWLMGHDPINIVSIVMGYLEDEKNCTNLYLGVLSWFPLSDVEKGDVRINSVWIVDNNDVRPQIMLGQLVALESADLYTFGILVYKELVNEMIEGKTLYYKDEMYPETSLTIIDLTNFQEMLAEVMGECLDRGGEFKQFESEPVQKVFPKNRA